MPLPETPYERIMKMSEINILSPHVADMIAAGEVVERPASVIKELCENAFDAGAKNITIEIRGGGTSLIRVTDDGTGMLPEDAGICFLRHATSKLQNERGLEAIGTFGFRGEALAAISSVSRIELSTRRRGANEGVRMTVEAGDIQTMEPFGCPEGTTMLVRDLFFNTPARLKFMKSDRAEGSACQSAALRCALGRSDISVRFIKDGEECFFTPGDGKLVSCVYSLLGRETALDFLDISGENEGVAVSGFVSSPRAAHGNRAKQFFFCNGRSIRSQLLQAAVEQAYKNTLLTGRYPACVVSLTLSPASVDVNVHPAKTEVKFRDERKAFDAVYYAALSALEASRIPSARPAAQPSAAAAPNKDFYKTMRTDEFREKYTGPATPKTGRREAEPPPVPRTAPGRGTIVWNRAPASSDNHVRESESPFTVSKGGPLRPRVPASVPETEAAREPEPESPAPLADVVPEFRLVGEAMRTYIIVEKGEELILIDKHAAHERMIFDRLKLQGQKLMSQTLLAPVVLNLSAEDMELLEKSKGQLDLLGFEIEPFGADSVAVRAVPADTDAADIPAMIEEICEKLRESASLAEADALDGILHTVACKAAIKAGWKTDAAEMETIAKKVLSGEVRYCPHGRPVSFTLTKKQLDKEFSRIV